MISAIYDTQEIAALSHAVRRHLFARNLAANFVKKKTTQKKRKTRIIRGQLGPFKRLITALKKCQNDIWFKN